MKHITLITGGARSGKSDYAITLSKGYSQKAFIATAEPFDDEMKLRINRHKRDRDPSYRLIEEPVELANTIRSLSQDTEIAVIDCLTVWVGNCLHRLEPGRNETFHSTQLINALKDAPCNLIIVTNEVGLGIIPDNDLSRNYRDILGSLNRQIAVLAQKVILMISGIPMVIKESEKNNFL
jgi:adenosylcobinamide kinase/adenosylcobinamide-phosphate guanylyltransferase